MRNFIEYRKKINHEFFNDVDSEEKAYVLGMIAADGYIYEKNARIQIELNEKDVQILYDIRKVMKCDVKINFRTRIDPRLKIPSKSAILSLSSRQMVDKLTNLGIIQNKSLTLTFPKIDDNLIPYFLRSYVEGDGHLGIHHNGTTPMLRVYSSRIFCEQFQAILKEKLEIKSSVKNKGKIGMFTISNLPDIIKTLDFIYKDATIYLQRKYDKYLLIKKLAVERDLKQLERRSKICSILYCGKKFHCKWLCVKHYYYHGIGKLTPIPL